MRGGMMPTAQCAARSPSMDEVKAVYHVEIEQQDKDDGGGRGESHPDRGEYRIVCPTPLLLARILP